MTCINSVTEQSQKWTLKKIDIIRTIAYNRNVKKVKETKRLFLKGRRYMEVAKVSSKGQITIPVSVRNALKLKAGDKIVILEENGRFYFENSAMLAFKRAEEAFAGEAEKAGFTSEEEMQEYMKEIRKEVRGY